MPLFLRKISFTIIGVSILFATFLFPINADAHPGRTDSNGCHTCNTNCTERWGIPYGFYHRHYPVRACFTPVPPNPVITTKEEKVPAEVNFKTIEQNDPTLSKGKKIIKTDGKKGVKQIVYTITLQDGKEINRVVKEEIMVITPIDKIVLIGTKENEQPIVAGASTKKDGSSAGWIIGILFSVGILYLIIRGITNTIKSNKN